MIKPVILAILTTLLVFLTIVLLITFPPGDIRVWAVLAPLIVAVVWMSWELWKTHQHPATSDFQSATPTAQPLPVKKQGSGIAMLVAVLGSFILAWNAGKVYGDRVCALPSALLCGASGFGFGEPSYILAAMYTFFLSLCVLVLVAVRTKKKIFVFVVVGWAVVVYVSWAYLIPAVVFPS